MGGRRLAAGGTALTQYSIQGATPVVVSSAEVTAKCGASTMYAKELALGLLLGK